ncbi:MAG: alpha/beta hydrolase fold domain-containing protein, partial [Novosphingobium sp.]|nr:alpha/beta hydrolase fold domain-containing protein [Novosphingobium sp.]
MARQMAAYTQMPPLSAATLPQMRQGMNRYMRPRLADVAVDKRVIAGSRGQPPVTIYVINAKPGASRPGILDTHGGGFILGTAEGDIADLQATCKALDCAAVTVDYRLAPETTYQGSIEDNYAGLKWLHANAAALGVDPRRIAVMGGSAGGGHAALLAITARDRGEVPVAFQCLIYPMLDDRTGSSRVPPPQVGHLIWTPQQNRYGWQSFLGMTPGGAAVTARAVPAR